MIVSACVSSFVGWRKDEGERERGREEKPREEEGESNISKQVPAPCSFSQCTREAVFPTVNIQPFVFYCMQNCKRRFKERESGTH